MQCFSKDNRSVFLLVVCSALILAFAFVIFLYVDITNTADNANILIRAISWGRFRDFYDLTVKYSQTNFAANYNVPTYILFAIWQLPVFFIAHKLNINYLESPVCMLWSKTLVLLFSVLSAWLIYKIVTECGENKKKGKVAAYLYLTSGFVFYAVFICGQLEAISTFLMLCGIYYYIRKRYSFFYLFFLLAVPFKMFALFLALPLIVYKEKNIIKALSFWVMLGVPLLVEKAMFGDSPVYRYALSSQSRDAVQNLLNAQVNLGRPISVYILLYIVLIVYLYLSNDMDNHMVIYSCFYVWAIFVIFSGINTYWVYLIAPFAILTICINHRYMRVDIFIETISSFSYMISIACMGTAIFKDDGLISRLFYPGIFTLPAQEELKYQTVDMLFASQGWKIYYTLFSTVFVGGVILLLLLTMPKLKRSDCSYDSKIKGIIWIRPLALLTVCGLILFASTSKTNRVAFNTRNYDANVAECDLINVESEEQICQDVVFSDTRNLDCIILKFNNTHYYRANTALLHIELLDQIGSLVFEDYIACCNIKDKEATCINLRGTKVNVGDRYSIRLSGKAGIEYYWDKESLCPYVVTSSEKTKLDNVRINGDKVENTYLWFEIR